MLVHGSRVIWVISTELVLVLTEIDNSCIVSGIRKKTRIALNGKKADYLTSVLRSENLIFYFKLLKSEKMQTTLLYMR